MDTNGYCITFRYSSDFRVVQRSVGPPPTEREVVSARQTDLIVTPTNMFVSRLLSTRGWTTWGGKDLHTCVPNTCQISVVAVYGAAVH